jgi:malate synthase
VATAAYISFGGLKATQSLAGFVAEVLTSTDLTPEAFWSGFAAIRRDLGPKNRALLAERDRLQAAIDRRHVARRGQTFQLAASTRSTGRWRRVMTGRRSGPLAI